MRTRQVAERGISKQPLHCPHTRRAPPPTSVKNSITRSPPRCSESLAATANVASYAACSTAVAKCSQSSFSGYLTQRWDIKRKGGVHVGGGGVLLLVVGDGQRAAEDLGNLVAAVNGIGRRVLHRRIDDLRVPLHAERDAVHEAPPPVASPGAIGMQQQIDGLQMQEGAAAARERRA